MSRGVFTNEAGLGSSAFAYDGVRGRTPEELGCLGIFQVFADTIVMCTVTGLCVLGSGVSGDPAGSATAAFARSLGPWGGWAVSLSTALFAAATLTAWSCYGREGLSYLTKGRGREAYALAAGGSGGAGVLSALGSRVFQLGDAMNGPDGPAQSVGAVPVAAGGDLWRGGLSETDLPEGKMKFISWKISEKNLVISPAL